MIRPSRLGLSELQRNDLAYEFAESHVLEDDNYLRNYSTNATDIPDAWPWALVDVPGSPKLSRLFSELDIHTFDNVDTINSLSTLEPPSSSKSLRNTVEDTSDGVTMSMLHDARHKARNFYLENTNRSGSEFPLTKAQISFLDVPYFQCNSSDVFFPTGTWVSPSPWKEIYPFPTPSHSKERLVNTATISEVSMSSLRSRVNRLEAYIASLADFIPQSHPMILKSMEDIADGFSEMGHHDKSTIWWRRIVARRESFQGAQSPDYLNAMHQLILSLLEQGDGVLNEIAELGKRLEKLINQNLSWEHPVAIGFLIYKARAFIRKGDYAESERLYRQILQVRLTQLGPRDTATIEIMSSLSLAISKRIRRAPAGYREILEISKTDEARSSEHLMSAAVQLFARTGEAYTTYQGQILGIRHMALLAELGYLEKAVNVARTGAERSKNILGESHPTTIEYIEYMGHLYEQQGRYQQSIDSFKKVLSLQEIDESMSGHVDRYEGLGKALRGAKQHQEALVYLNKTFRAWYSIFGVLSFRTKIACYNLGDSFAQAHQYDQALHLYHSYLENVRAAGGDGHPLISEIDGWVNKIEELSIVRIVDTPT